MKSVIKEVNENSDKVIKENNFLTIGFQNRLSTRIMHIFQKYKIVVNSTIISRKLEENLQEYVNNKCSTDVIKKSTLSFVNKINEKNKSMLNIKIASNFIESIKSIMLVYDNAKLNEEILKRINIDTGEIINEINKNNYNYVIESINLIIKNIIQTI